MKGAEPLMILLVLTMLLCGYLAARAWWPIAIPSGAISVSILAALLYYGRPKPTCTGNPACGAFQPTDDTLFTPRD